MVDYLYDSGSRMLQRTEGTTTTNFHWDGWDLVREEKDDGTDVEVTNYLVPHGEVMAFERDGDWFYLHGDGLSSTQLVTDSNGDQAARMVYGAWGETLSSNSSVPGSLDVRFVGGLGVRNDNASGLIYMRHRWYDAGLGRFISRDPIGHSGGINLYAYPNPVDYVDPDGLSPFSFSVVNEPLQFTPTGVSVNLGMIGPYPALAVGNVSLYRMRWKSKYSGIPDCWELVKGDFFTVATLGGGVKGYLPTHNLTANTPTDKWQVFQLKSNVGQAFSTFSGAPIPLHPVGTYTVRYFPPPGNREARIYPVQLLYKNVPICKDPCPNEGPPPSPSQGPVPSL